MVGTCQTRQTVKLNRGTTRHSVLVVQCRDDAEERRVVAGYSCPHRWADCAHQFSILFSWDLSLMERYICSLVVFMVADMDAEVQLPVD
jgi:hypothetical protein